MTRGVVSGKTGGVSIFSGKPKLMRQGQAMRVVFFYPGEEGTYIDHIHVKLYDNGMVHLKSRNEEVTTHLQNCEIIWQYDNDVEERSSKIRLLPRNTKETSPEFPTQPEV